MISYRSSRSYYSRIKLLPGLRFLPLAVRGSRVCARDAFCEDVPPRYFRAPRLSTVLCILYCLPLLFVAAKSFCLCGVVRSSSGLTPALHVPPCAPRPGLACFYFAASTSPLCLTRQTRTRSVVCSWESSRRSGKIDARVSFGVCCEISGRVRIYLSLFCLRRGKRSS